MMDPLEGMDKTIHENYVEKQWTRTHSCYDSYFIAKVLFRAVLPTCMLRVPTLRDLTFIGSISKYRQNASRAALDSVECSVKSSFQRYPYFGAAVYF